MKETISETIGQTVIESFSESKAGDLVPDVFVQSLDFFDSEEYEINTQYLHIIGI